MKNVKWVLCVLVALGLLTGGVVGTSLAADMKWRMSAILAPEDPMTLHAVDWAKRVGEKTNGRIQITVFDSGKLGHERETAEQMQTGALECGILSNGILVNFAPVNGLYNLPYVFVNTQQCLAFDKTPEAAKLRELFEKECGLKMIGFFPEGFRHVMNSKRDVNAPADLKGLKIRVMENPIHVASLNAMGATATPISWNEVITSLQTGVIDGFENSIPTLSSVKAWELLKHLSFTTHFYDVGFIVMAKKTWDSLSAEDQKIMIEAQDEAVLDSLKVIEKQKQEGIEAMKANGVTINEPDLKPFVEATAPVREKYINQYPDMKPVLEKALSLQ